MSIHLYNESVLCRDAEPDSNSGAPPGHGAQEEPANEESQVASG